MIAEIKLPTKKEASLPPPVIKARTKEYVPDSGAFYTILVLLFFVIVAIIYSLWSNLLFLKELSASGLILGYLFTMQLSERKLKVLENNSQKNQNLN